MRTQVSFSHAIANHKPYVGWQPTVFLVGQLENKQTIQKFHQEFWHSIYARSTDPIAQYLLGQIFSVPSVVRG